MARVSHVASERARSVCQRCICRHHSNSEAQCSHRSLVSSYQAVHINTVQKRGYSWNKETVHAREGLVDHMHDVGEDLAVEVVVVRDEAHRDLTRDTTPPHHTHARAHGFGGESFTESVCVCVCVCVCDLCTERIPSFTNPS